MAECFRFSSIRILILLLADDVFLLALLNSDIQLMLTQFTAEFETMGMKIGNSNGKLQRKH